MKHYTLQYWASAELSHRFRKSFQSRAVDSLLRVTQVNSEVRHLFAVGRVNARV